MHQSIDPALITASGDSPPAEISNEDLRAFYEISSDMLCVAGFDGYFKHVNPAWQQVMGHAAAKMIGRSWLSFVHPDDRARSSAEAARIAAGIGTVQFANRYRRADGSYRWVSWTASPDVDAGVIYAVARDVSEHRQRERDLESSERRFRTLIDSAPSGILIADESGSILLANRVVEEMFGYPRRGLDGCSVDDLVPEHARREHGVHRDDFMEEPRQRVMGAGRVLQGRHRDGRIFPVSIGLAPLAGEDGGVVAATLTDMTDQQRVESELTRANEELQARLADLEQLGHEAELISDMGEMLQASQSSDEAHRVIELFASRLFVSGSGAIGIVNDSRNLAENVVGWGPAGAGEPVYHPGDCWALRRGKAHVVRLDETRLACPHLSAATDGETLCVPLLAQGEALGVLTLLRGSGDSNAGWSQLHRLSTTFADHLALALANLRLRDTLQVQSIRDPLTGLFNRRYLEESLEREVARALRRNTSLGVIMFDLDHFKAFNDAHGHRAGDQALEAMGSLLLRSVRGEDIPCRYGGEEFAVILPDASLENVAARAEQIRRALAGLGVTHAGRDLGRVTLSAGVAVYPTHGSTPDEVVQSADRALYAAKAGGRNRVALPSPPDAQ